MITSNILRNIIIVCALIAFGSGIGIYTAQQKQSLSPPQIQGLMWPDSKTLLPFSTIDQNDNEFGLQNLQGKWSFLFFGYTHCPDICPITLTVLDQIYTRLLDKPDQTDIQVIFISVDPERDSSEKLQEYVSYFNKDFYGLGGSLEQIQSLTKQMGVPFFHEPANDNGDYLVDHSAAIFLIDPRGQMIAVMSAPHLVDVVLSRFLAIRSFIDKQT